jgi:hypothetical protein
MITLEITCNTGRNWTTGFNGSYEDAKNYFLNKTFTDEDDDGRETHHKCTGVKDLSANPLSEFGSSELWEQLLAVESELFSPSTDDPVHMEKFKREKFELQAELARRSSPANLN